MTLVYRLEDRHGIAGYARLRDGEAIGARCLPPEYETGKLGDWWRSKAWNNEFLKRRYVFGFASMDQLSDWFAYPEHIDPEIGLSVFESFDVIAGETQVVFSRSAARLLRRYSTFAAMREVQYA